MTMSKGRIKAILDDDFKNLLQRLGKYESVTTGNERCYFCNDTVTLDNISMVFPHNNEVCFCCDKPDCTERLVENGDD